MPDLAAPVAPAAPSAPAPAAPSTSAPAAPAPVAPATPAPVPPAAAVPAAPSAPAKFDPQTATAPPSAADYPQNSEGNDQFMEDNGAWLIAHPAEAQKLHAERLKAEDTAFRPSEEAPDAVAEAAKAVEAAAPDAEKPPADKPVAPATPASIEEWTGKAPELKAAFEKYPEVHQAVMEMARYNEAVKPVLDIVGTKEEAEFAVDHANRLVTLQANWMMAAEDPEMVEPAWEQVVDMFKSRDAEGKEIAGPGGKPQLDPDFKPFVARAASFAMQEATAPWDATITALEARLAGNYPNDEAREADEDSLQKAKYSKAAYAFVAEDMKGGKAPKLPALPPNATKEQIDFQKKLEDQQKDLDAKQGKQTVEQRKAVRQQLNSEVDRSWSKTISDKIEAHVKAMQDRGEYLPDYVLNDKWINPQTHQATKVSAFGMHCYQQLNAAIKGNPIHRAKLAQLEAMGTAGKDARIAELNRLTDLYLPKIRDKRITEIQDGIRGAQNKAPTSATPSIARVEPQSAATVMPAAQNDDQMMKAAREEASKVPEFATSSAKDREEIVMQIYAKKKYGG